MLADDSGWQIKVLGLNGIVGQMTRHRWRSAHGHSLAFDRNITPPPTHQHSIYSRPSPLKSPPSALEARVFHLQ